MAFDIDGPLDVELAERVIHAIILRHEILRTVYVDAPEGTCQRILPETEVDFALDRMDLSHLNAEQQQSRTVSVLQSKYAHVFDLSKDVVAKAGYILLEQCPQDDTRRGLLWFMVHHIAVDGWSLDILMREFSVLYKRYSGASDWHLPPLTIQYADYAHWQKQQFDSQDFSARLDYWLEHLDNPPLLHGLKTQSPRPAVKQNRGLRFMTQLPLAVGQNLSALAESKGLTPFMLLHSALALVLAKNSNSDDIIVGSPITGRTRDELSPLIGFFVNTLALRVNTAFDDFDAYLAHVKEVHLAAQENQDVPFELIVEKLRLPRNTAHTPLFQIALSTISDYGLGDTNAKQDDRDTLTDFDVSMKMMYETTVLFDMQVGLFISDEGVELSWTFDSSLFERSYIDQLDSQVKQVLVQFAELAGRSNSAFDLQQLNILDDAQQAAVASEVTLAGDYELPQQRMHQRFEAQVERHPDKIALVCGDTELSYQALNERANRLAHYLVQHCAVVPDMPVGICLERGCDLVVGILAINKAGGAYVPLDPANPAARLAHIMSDAKVSHLITNSGLSGQVEMPDTVNVIALDSEPLQAELATMATDNVQNGCDEHALAYLLYTSGSTGTPKGCAIEQGAFDQFLDAMYSVLDGELDEHSKMLGVTTVSFDVAGLDLWGPLAFGGQLVLASQNDLANPDALATLMQAHDINLMQATPATWQMLADNHWQGKDNLSVLCGGEALPVKLAEWLLAHAKRLFNGYGPTEATVYSLVNEVTEQQLHDKGVVLGGALPGRAHLVVDGNGQPLPVDAVGELLIGGPGLARGYYNQPALSAAQFKTVAVGGCSARFYHTGDLVRRLADGHFEYLGRNDDQVKVRGMRIELAEIEARTAALPGVADARVLLRDGTGGDKSLVAYLIKAAAQDSGEVTIDEEAQAQQNAAFISDIKRQLSHVLPGYMIPSAFVTVSAWPLSANGKVDKAALLAMAVETGSAGFVEPQTATERLLVSLWSELLGLTPEQVSTTANFFELGRSLVVAHSPAQQHSTGAGFESGSARLVRDRQYRRVGGVV